MKKLILSAAVLTLVIVGVNAGGNKVKVNHKGTVIEISEKALPGHLGHGDQLVTGGNDCGQSGAGGCMGG